MQQTESNPDFLQGMLRHSNSRSGSLDQGREEWFWEWWLAPMDSTPPFKKFKVLHILVSLKGLLFRVYICFSFPFALSLFAYLNFLIILRWTWITWVIKMSNTGWWNTQIRLFKKDTFWIFWSPAYFTGLHFNVSIDTLQNLTLLCHVIALN